MLAPRLITCSQGVWRPSSSCLFVALLKEPSLLARDRRADQQRPKVSDSRRVALVQPRQVQRQRVPHAGRRRCHAVIIVGDE